MTREQRLESCRICRHKKPNLERGMLCALTDDYANFEGKCETFELDEYAARAQERDKKRHAEALVSEENNKVMSAAAWFLWIFLLSILNTAILAAGSSWNFLFGLGMTTVWEQIYLAFVGPLDTLAITVSVLISSIFLPIGIYARKLSKTAFIIGIILYGIDTLIMLVFVAWIPIIIHGIVLFLMIRGYRLIDTVKPSEPEIGENILDSASL
ncbi:MAG: hypothetical protein MK081_11065 [Flavobacteriales bacterium]|nr:hypothetical protein [Flavobacteriales bacterium]